MADDGDVRGFILAIRAASIDDGFVCQTQSVNQGVPDEVVIMQLRAFLKGLERQYFASFNENNR